MFSFLLVISRPLKMFFNGLVKQAMDGLHEHQRC